MIISLTQIKVYLYSLYMYMFIISVLIWHSPHATKLDEGAYAQAITQLDLKGIA